MVEDLRAAIEEHESQRGKIDMYEVLIEDRNSMVKQIQIQMETLNENYSRNELLLEESSNKIEEFVAKNKDY